MKKFLQPKKVLFYIFLVIILGILIFFHIRGITYYDEGYILSSALRTAHGEIPYRDFDMVYAPLSFVITSVFLFVFGESVLAGRIAALFISVVSLTTIYLILKQFTKNTLLIFGVLLLFIAWGPTHMNFPWPTMYAACFILLTLLFILLGSKKKSKKYLLLAGIFTVLVFLSKQNFGAGTLLVCFLSLLQFKKRKKMIAYYLYGVGVGSGIYFIYLVITSSLIPFINNMYLYTLKRILIDKALDTPFLYEGSLLVKFVKLVFYTSPLIVSIVAFIHVLKTKKRVLLIIPTMVSVFYLLGIRPTTDYVHISPLIAFMSLSLAVGIVFAKKLYIKVSLIVLLLVFIVVGFYTAYNKGYYQWDPKLQEATIYASNSRTKIYLNAKQVEDIDDLVSYVQKRTKQNEYIFVNYYAPMVYFLTDRENPTPYDFISTNQLPISYQQSITEILEQKKVRVVILHDINKNEDSIVSNYIRKHYKRTKTIGAFVIYEK